VARDLVSTAPARPIAKVAAVSLDCADPGVLAAFYLSLLGGQPLWHSGGSVGIRVPGLVVVLQRVADYQPPAWPGSSLVHLDLAPASSLAAAVTAAVQAGATLASFQPDPRWRVLLDPAGHPFCLTTVTPD
jgi:catechol-2,3-dioxygenase